MVYVGGKRERLLLQSLRRHVQDGLDYLGWFDVGRPHASVTVRTEPVDSLVEILPNVVAITEESLNEQAWEMGSNLTEFRWEYAIDVYAEDSAVGRQIWGDVRGLLGGRFSDFSPESNFAVMDYSAATPTELFICHIENMVGGRQREYQKGFQKFWWTLLFDVVDYYGSDVG